MSSAALTMDQLDEDKPAVNPCIIALAVTLATFMEVLDTSIAWTVSGSWEQPF